MLTAEGCHSRVAQLVEQPAVNRRVAGSSPASGASRSSLHPEAGAARMVPPNEVEILLVEDNPDDIELTLRALTRHNLANRVHVARDGAEALDFLLGDPSNATVPKVILLDLKLPKVDGLEVLRRIKESDRTKTIPVVVLTSSREEPDIVKSYRLGANSYIVKPVDFEAFVRAVADLGLYWLLLNERPPPRPAP